MDLLVWSLIFAIFFNLALFVPAFFLKTDKLTDLSYALTFIILAVVFYLTSPMQSADKLILFMVLAWAIRLGLFLLYRINKKGKDSRFDSMRAKPWSFIRFWFFQGVSVFIVLLASLLFWDTAHGAGSIWTVLGLVVWAVGLVIEAIADLQKYRFSLKGSKDWIDVGLWKISRHPNYLGEILVWSGIYIAVVSGLGGLDKLYALASPLYIIVILMFFSGVPILEKNADIKWGNNKKYREYKRNVPVLVPSLSSLRRL